MVKRIHALIIKEFMALLRDPRSRIILIGPPLLQLMIFAFAATLEVKNVSLLVYNQDQGKHGYELVQRFVGSQTFGKIKFVNSQAEFKPAIDQQKVIAAVHIPQDFSRDLDANESADVQVILDGRRSNAAQIVNGYITRIVIAYDQEIQNKQGIASAPVVIVERNWFNQNLEYLWFTVPSLIGILSMLISLMVTALSVARERELGTFEQLLVSPLVPYEILIGKTVPAVLIGMIEGIAIWLCAVIVFGIPFTGSFLLFLFALFLFIMSVVGAGLFISSMAKTQQQAILGAFLVIVPFVTLSGYAAPVENMPHWLQVLDGINPLKYFLITVKGLFLKNMSFGDVWSNTWPLIFISIFTLTFSGWFFHKKLE
jgi:ABC-2 type transport system permease protein